MKTENIAWNVPEAPETALLLSPLPGTKNDPLTGWRSAFDTLLFNSGVIMLALSGGLFLAHDTLLNGNQDRTDSFGWFTGHYVLAIIFSVSVLINGGFTYLFRNDRRQQASSWLALLLWWLSAFALNRQLAVFEQSVPWLCWLIVGSGALMVLHTWADTLPRWAQRLLYAGLAGTLLLALYQAVYLGALYPISVPGLLALGISVHTFIPLLMAFLVGRQLLLAARQRTYLRSAIVAGLAVPVTLLIVFLFNWHRTVDRLNQVRMDAALSRTSDLPDWVRMAQQLSPSPLTDRILKVGLVYGTSPWSRSLGDLTALDDVRLHDPLVVIAQNLLPVPTFSGDEQTKLLRAVSQQHYGTESKLWSGRNLTTSQVATQVRIWPQYRLSYTEKTLWVQSAAQWGNREALYTIHLPEGSAVSALSLWVNGREEPARLTTQAKADSAYKTIVGVENRDPSVVTWQEGNRVTVRVFPVLPGQSRQMKIGITSPLRFDGKMLTYLNPWFEGPDANDAEETLKLSFTDEPAGLVMSGVSGLLINRELLERRAYTPDWSLQLKAPDLSPEPFRLAGKAYNVVDYWPDLVPFQPANVYLDVNQAWAKDEFTLICDRVSKQRGTRLWVFRDGLVEVTATNRDQLFAALADQTFSLFPIDRIDLPETALLITKGTPNGPTLTDLEGSPLSERLTKKATTLNAPIRTCSLSEDLPPYLKTLAELHVLHAMPGDVIRTVSLLSNHQFAANPVATDRVTLAGSGMAITSDSLATEPQTANLAPDHLLRLFTYNQLMNRVGRQYFDKAYRNNETLAAIAQMGHVVSPVSSLVVLETQNDYDRFGIKKDKDGLDNATLKQDGAVPEPHEWAMILLIALLVAWFYIRPRVVV